MACAVAWIAAFISTVPWLTRAAHVYLVFGSLKSSGYPVTITFAVGTFARIASTVAAMFVASVPFATIVSPATMWDSHEPFGNTKQFCMTAANPTSLPPTVSVTRVAVAGIAGTCPAITSTVEAPEQAGNATSFRFASTSRSFGYPLELV